jgi:dTDP-4-dehydrorhamnose 3,5-epimerase-like enzyme
MKKYLVIPSEVRSKSDKQKHYIPSNQLMNLYNVNPSDCIVVTPTRKKTYSRESCKRLNINYDDPKLNPYYQSVEDEDIYLKLVGRDKEELSKLQVLQPDYHGLYKLDPPLLLVNIYISLSERLRLR